MMKILRFRLMEATPGAEGSTSVPSTSTPSTAPSSNNESGGSDFDFAGLAMDSGESGGDAPAVVITPPPAPASTTPPVSGAAAKPPTASTPASTPPPSTAASTTAPPAVPPVAAAPTSAATPPAAAPGQTQGQPPAAAPQANQPTQALTPEAVAQSFAQHRQTFLPQLETLYAIPEAEVEALRTNPETALPKLAAKLHYEVQLGVYNSMIQAMPEMIGHIMTQRMEVENLERDFKSMWPQLYEKPEYDAVAENCIRAIRQVNPKMAMKEVLQKAGMMAMLTLGLPLPAPQGTQQQSVAPAVPPVGATRVAPPGRPAGVAASGGQPLAAPGSGDEGNIFAQMVEDSRNGII